MPEVFRSAVRAINTTIDGKPWLTDRQLDELRDQILRQPNRTLLEANEAIQSLLFKAQVDANELTGEQDPVVISSDGTNEAAYVTQARKQAKAWNAVENFCKPFDRTDHDKELTGIAFLIVCDMLITGFDAPVEQVMYIDKKIREHTLLQAIARVNRVR